MMYDEIVKLELPKDSALVIFEMLLRIEETENLSFGHPAEHHAISSLLCVLESKLAEPFDPTYQALLEGARKAVVIKYGGGAA